MQVSAQYFNAHANANRIFGNYGGNMPAPAIAKKDEAKYALTKEKNADAKRKPAKVSLKPMPF